MAENNTILYMLVGMVFMGVLMGSVYYSGNTIIQGVEGITLADNAFKVVDILGGSNSTADNAEDTLTFVAGTGMIISANYNTDTITFNSTGGGGENTSASNLGAGENIFAQEVLDDLEFKTLVDDGTGVVLSSDANEVTLSLDDIAHDSITNCATDGHILKWRTGTDWGCESDVGGGSGDNLGDHTATTTLQMGSQLIEFSESTQTISANTDGFDFNIPTGDAHDLRINSTTEYRFEGSDANWFNNKLTSLGSATLASDAVRADQLGLLGPLVTTTCADTEIIKYNATATEWQCESDESAAGGGGMNTDLSNMVSPTAPTVDLEMNDNNIIGFDQLTFNSVTAPIHASGQLFFDTDENTLGFHNSESDITLEIGQETWVYVHNDSGGQIDNGEAVYVSGAQGGSNLLPTVELAQADSLTTSRTFIGLATHDIPNNSDGFVTTFGQVRDFDTSAFSNGDEVWVSETTAGGLTNIRPTQPNFTIPVGQVTRDHASLGSVIVIPTPIKFGEYTQHHIAFGGSDGFIKESADIQWNDTTKELRLDGYVQLEEVTAPGTPSSNFARVYVEDVAGTSNLFFIDDTGDITNLLDHVSDPKIAVLTAGGATLQASSTPARTTIDGTNMDYIVLDFDTGSSETVVWNWEVPDGMDDTADIDVRVRFQVASGTAGVCWDGSWLGRTAGETVDSAFGTVIGACDSSTGTNSIETATMTFTSAQHGLAAGDSAFFKLSRDVADGTDTNANDARLIDVRVVWS